MSRFGTYLQKLGLLTVEQLDAALAHQAERGARLGTNLVELGRIDVELLAECLSGYHGVPLPPRKWLQRPQRSAVKRVTRGLVERTRFVPMRLEGTTLHVAVMDPRHPRVLDDLRFASGCKIEAYVLPEIWMHDWLLKLFDIPRGIRHVQSGRSSAPPELDPKYDFQATQPVHPPQSPPPVHPPKSPPPVHPPPVPAQAVRATQKSGARLPAVQSPAPPSSLQAPGPQRASLTNAAGSGELSAAAWQAAPAWGSITPAQTAPNAPSVPVQSLAELSAVVEQPVPSSIPAAPEPEAAAFWSRRPVFNWNVPDESAPVPTAVPTPVSRSPVPRSPLPEPGAEVAASTQPSGIMRPVRHAAGELARLETELLQVETRERLIELCFAIGTSFAATLGLFVVQRGMVQGLRCVARGVPRPIDGVLQLEPPCMLIDMASATEPVRMPAAVQPSDQRVLQLVDDANAVEVALFPVAIKGRVVNVLYASNGGEPLGAVAFAALSALAEQMGAAYEQLIRIRKTAGTR